MYSTVKYIKHTTWNLIIRGGGGGGGGGGREEDDEAGQLEPFQNPSENT
jgi:hypothetical protein